MLDRMTSTLFGRIARHPRIPGRDSREDRLTEVFAAVLDHEVCTGLAQYVVRGWLKGAWQANKLAPEGSHVLASLSHGEWSCMVRTQVHTSVGDHIRRLDLALRFSASDAEDIVIDVEIKHGTDPHTHQLQAYLDAQLERGTSRGMVL
jgi:hypothetical protein